ncbi:DUF6249 domain-containing protein [Flectobacillus major]|uniref:DUF6249 domain-containing protein n=1 Tax=Flectobacillus major TaxID=103 RepID=UPI00131EF0A6|nr:DUF6249 domain-containing protein [Flectobacillus major]
MLALLIPIIATVGGLTMIVFLRKFENDEKMAMIAKGIVPPARGVSSKVNPANSLRWGLLGMGVGIGLLIGHFLENNLGFDDDVAYFSMIFVFGGAGLLFSYFLQMKIDKNNANNNNID